MIISLAESSISLPIQFVPHWQHCVREMLRSATANASVAPDAHDALVSAAQATFIAQQAELDTSPDAGDEQFQRLHRWAGQLRHAAWEIVFAETHDPTLIQQVLSQVETAIDQAALTQSAARSVDDQIVALPEQAGEHLDRHMLEVLNHIALEVGNSLDLDQLLHSCLDMLARLIGVDHGAVLLLEPDTGHLVDRAVLGGDGPIGYFRFAPGQGIAGWVGLHKKSALIDDVQQDERCTPLQDDVDLVELRFARSALAVPLLVQRDMLGVLMLTHKQVGYFTQNHLRLLSASAGHIAIAVHHAILYYQIEQQLLRQGEMLRNERRATAQSAAILQSLSDGVIVCDTEGVVLIANMSAARILNRSIEELLTWHLPELFVRVFGERSKHTLIEDLLRHPHDERGQYRSHSSNLQLGALTVQLSVNPVVSSKDEVMGIVAVFRDITREVESDRLKDEFIGAVSHELRTPMTSVKGYTQLLVMGSLGPVNDTQHEFLTTIHANAERMITLINDLLEFTKIEAGSVELELRSMRFGEALGASIMELRRDIQAREHELLVNIQSGLPMIYVDAACLDTILFNVLQNAVKYTPSGGSIRVDAWEITDDLVPACMREGLCPGRYVQIDINDNGVGIAPHEQELVFNRFYRTENSLKVEAGGTGLGLAIARSLAKLMGGRIWLESRPGEGSTFSVIVPAV
jgi:PAS domain S-box-containing protein